MLKGARPPDTVSDAGRRGAERGTGGAARVLNLRPTLERREGRWAGGQAGGHGAVTHT